MNIMSRAFENLQNFIALGGTVVTIIIALFVIALAICLIKIEGLMRASLADTQALTRQLKAIDEGAEIAPSELPAAGVYGRIARASMQSKAAALASGLPLHEARERVLIEADAELSQFDWGNRALELIAQVAPLLGLFGTVLGMIDAFRALQEAGSAVDPSVLAGGIWVALMTTAAGLAVAMPVTIALSFFEGQSQKMRQRAEQIIEIIFRPGLGERA